MNSRSLLVVESLEEWQIKSCKFTGQIKSDGEEYNLAEDGTEFNLIRYEEFGYSLTLQYLTKDETKNIQNGIRELKRNNQALEIPRSIIEIKGYIDFKTVSATPTFLIVPSEIKPSNHVGTDKYSLGLKLIERVWY